MAGWGSVFASGLGGLGDAGVQFGLAAYGNAKAAKAAKKDRNFQEYMSDTAYQRMVVDLKKAGLNPMMALMKGGASTPGGSTAKTFVPDAKPVTTALATRKLSQELKNMESTERLSNSQATKNQMETMLAEAGIARQNQDTATSAANQRAIDMSTAIAHLSVPAATNAANIEKGMMGPIYAHSDRVFRSIGGLLTGAAGGVAVKAMSRGGRNAKVLRNAKPTRRPHGGRRTSH